jgi:hypothetical protein
METLRLKFIQQPSRLDNLLHSFVRSSGSRAEPYRVSGYVARVDDGGLGVEWCEFAPPAIRALLNDAAIWSPDGEVPRRTAFSEPGHRIARTSASLSLTAQASVPCTGSQSNPLAIVRLDPPVGERRRPRAVEASSSLEGSSIDLRAQA